MIYNDKDSYIKVDSKLVALCAKNTISNIDKEREEWIRESIKVCRNAHWRHGLFFRRERITVEQAKKEIGASEVTFICGRQYERCKELYKIVSKYDGEITLSIKDAITINLKLGEKNGKGD